MADDLHADDIYVRNTEPRDYAGIRRLSEAIYPKDEPWLPRHLDQHRALFPEGQFVAAVRGSERVVGMAASLRLSWDDYDRFDSYNDLTAEGFFTNHDPEGRTLYGAEVMVAPDVRRRGIGAKLYAARRALVESLGLLRIRAGARLVQYHRYADEMSAEAYVVAVVRGDLYDPTLTFQLNQGFEVLAVVPDYLHHDPRSQGYAALIEWINAQVATPGDVARRPVRFQRPRSDAP